MEYKKSIVGRQKEQEILQKCIGSERPEFIAVYGRRRVGKTYLVKQFFEDNFDFYASGVYQVSRAEQLKRWQVQLKKYSGRKFTRPKDWFEAFDQLQEYLQTLTDRDKIVVFIDELPWFDTPKSNFIRAVEVFWNTWASTQKSFKLIVCGSATTWMTNKLLGDKGGLHNRVTRPIRLSPFTLAETKLYLESMEFDWSESEIMEAYMIFGGIPYYLSLLAPELSLRQNVDELFFAPEAILKPEYEFLFNSLFSEAGIYRKVVELLSSKLKGLTRTEIIADLKAVDNGNLSEILDNLEKCDFLRTYRAFGKRQRDMLYQLTDMFTLFYLRFVKNSSGTNEQAWSTMKEGQRNAWSGYAFELVCILHINQIKKALGISGIASNFCTWSKKGNGKGAQIDLLIDRDDNVVNLCEMKYGDRPYELTKDYVEWIKERRDIFKADTQTNKTLRITFVSPYGIAKGKYSSTIQSVVTQKDLFSQL